MKRRDVLFTGGVASLATSLFARTTAIGAAAPGDPTQVPNRGKALSLPNDGPPRVAVLIGPDTVAIDLVGPWESFTNVVLPGGKPGFLSHTVAATMQPVSVEGLWVTPHYTFENVPQPQVIVIPAQRNLPSAIQWVKGASARSDVVMSVCTGAFLLAKTGLLDGLEATTHHDAYDDFARLFPKVDLVRGPRYVETEKVSSAGGESSGIDLALRVVERYYGPKAAALSAYEMEHVRRARPQSLLDV